HGYTHDPARSRLPAVPSTNHWQPPSIGVHMYTMSELSSQRAAVLAFLRERVGEGAPPSLAEIAAHCGFASRNAAQKHVQALAEVGLIELRSGQKRGIRIPGGEPDALLTLPVLGRVAAGLPLGAD